MLQPTDGSPSAHMLDPPRPAGGVTRPERSGWGRARDRSDLHAGMPPEHAEAYHEASVIEVLDALGMPTDDVRAILAADDPVVVHRYIELHGERLAERLADQLQALVRAEHTLSQASTIAAPGRHHRAGFPREVPDGTQ